MNRSVSGSVLVAPFDPVRIECEPCGQRGRYNIARLMEKYGDMKLPELRHVLANCPKAKSVSIHDQCKVRYGEDSRLVILLGWIASRTPTAERV